MKYNLDTIKNIELNYVTKNNLDENIIDLINLLEGIISAKNYKLTPNFVYKSKIIVNRDNIDKLIDSLRLNINKLSDKNYNNQIIKIKNNLQELHKEFEDSDIEKCSLIIFEIASTNLFYSKLYAKLYHDLSNEFTLLKVPLISTLKTFIKSYDSIENISSVNNYDLFCKIIKDNEKRLATLNFFIELIKFSAVDINFILDIISHVIVTIKQSHTKQSDIEQLVEHLYLIIINLHQLLKDYDIWTDITNFVEVYKKMKPKDNISYKTIFRFMDIHDIIKE
tara:strand:+ start:41 stop:880 length:840 start_codon:yes stop_codon:yes gene_type:complete